MGVKITTMGEEMVHLIFATIIIGQVALFGYNQSQDSAEKKKNLEREQRIVETLDRLDKRVEKNSLDTQIIKSALREDLPKS